MKAKTWKCTLVAIMFLFSTGILEAAKLKLGGTEWSPYIGSQLKNHGIAAEIVAQIFKHAGHEVEFVFFPWKRTQLLVKDGDLDGLAIAWFTEERAKTMAYSIPYINTAIFLIKRKDDPFIYNKIEDLEGKNVGVLRGYGYLKKIESDKIQKSIVNSLDQNLLKLVKKRIDLTMEEKLNAEKILASMPKEVQNALTFLEKPFEVKELHITLSKNIPNHQELLNDFNTALASMVKDGSYQHLIDNLSPSPLSIDQTRIAELKQQ